MARWRQRAGRLKAKWITSKWQSVWKTSTQEALRKYGIYTIGDAAKADRKLNPEFETLFLPTSIEHMFLSSSMVKQIAGFGGDISHFVPECLLEKINQRLCRTAD